MVKFTRCEIDERGEYLIIEASVDNMSYYNDVYLESISIVTDEEYSPDSVSNNKAYFKDFADDEGDYTKKSVSLRICAKDLLSGNFNKNIFFVYVYATGYPDPSVLCGMDNCYTMTVAVNMRPVYNMAMKYINELNENCSVPRGFIDMFLKLKAFELSLKTGHINKAIHYWNTLFKDKKNVSFKGCGCHGIS